MITTTTTTPRVGPDPIRTEAPDLRAARASLRAQIARLERELGCVTVDMWEQGSVRRMAAGGSKVGTARFLDLGELEETRDRLVEQLRATREVLAERADGTADARARLEAMLTDPAAHRYEIVRHDELGERSCGAYHVLPRLGIVGMLFGWWCVKLSSGCP